MSVQAGEVWSDLDHRIRDDGRGQLAKVVNVAAVMSSLHNILQTYRGERVMLPEFGSDLRGVLFESMTDTFLKYLTQQVQETIEVWEDRVRIVQVEVSSDPDQQRVDIVIQFVIKGYGDVFKYQESIKGE